MRGRAARSFREEHREISCLQPAVRLQPRPFTPCQFDSPTIISTRQRSPHLFFRRSCAFVSTSETRDEPF